MLREYVKQVEEKAMAEGKPTKEIMAINAMVFKKIKNYESN